jgi:hypothetical protein
VRTKHIYLHIGTPKAASQTIQEGLFINRNQLQEAGWLVPIAGAPHGKAHHYLPWQLHWLGVQRDDPHSFKSVINEIEQASAERIIISSEKFWDCTPIMLRLLQETLKDYHITVIAYVRQQDHWLQSHWLHQLKAPHLARTALPPPFQMWIESGLQDTKILLGEHEINGDFVWTLDQWAAVFGLEHMRVRVLEAGQLQGHVFHDFLAACDVSELERFLVPRDVNFSPGAKTVASLQYLLSTIYHAGDTPKIDEQPANRVTTRICHLMLQYGEKKGWNSPRANYITAALHHLIMSKFEGCNTQLARKYLGREQLFYKPFEEQLTPEYDLGQLTGTEVLEMFGFIIPRIADWMQEYQYLPQSSEAVTQAEQISMLQKQVKLLTDELLSVYRTRGWQFLSWYWQLRNALRSLLPFARTKQVPPYERHLVIKP